MGAGRDVERHSQSSFARDHRSQHPASRKRGPVPSEHAPDRACQPDAGWRVIRSVSWGFKFNK